MINIFTILNEHRHFWNQIFKLSKTELIKQYKQLSYFFMSDGNLKSFKQQLIEYADFKKKNKKDDRNIYHSTFLVAIDSNELIPTYLRKSNAER